MKTRLVLFFVAMVGLSACEWGKPKIQTADINMDTLAFVYHTKKVRATDCGNKPDSACTVFSIKYPLFSGDSLLNDTILKRLTTLFMVEKPDTGLAQYAKRFLSDYEAFKKYDSRSSVFFTLNSYAKILRQDSSLTTLEVGGYTYQGGAHGSTVTTFVNWNTKKHTNISLKDIFITGYESKLTAVADTIFRQEEKLKYDQSLKNDYFFKDDKFALNENFSITPIGLRFLYNQYEIKPYAAGQTELNIPYTKIKTLLRPNTVVTQYLK